MRKLLAAVVTTALALVLSAPCVALADNMAINDGRPDNDLDMSIVTRKSKKVKVRSLWSFQKGDVLKLKIGKKKYAKKVNKGSKAVIKIKRPKTWQKVSVSLYDASGAKVGKTCKERVYYSNGVKRGMTKKQVRRSYGYGKPDFTSTLDGGYKAWFYWDGDGSTYCVVFDKRGKVGSFD